MARMPGICESGPATSISSCCVVFVRSLHGLATKPPNPPVGDVSWKMLFASGTFR